MLDENFPTFYFKETPDSPSSSIVYFTANGSERTDLYFFQKPNPALPTNRNKYEISMHDTLELNLRDKNIYLEIKYAEVSIAPEFTQPTLSAAEIRQNGGVPPPPQPMIPDGFTIQLCQPARQVLVKAEKSTWMGKESFEFEVPQVAFPRLTASRIDREQNDPYANPAAAKIAFQWRRESILSKDMTCYMTGSCVGGRRSKEPDITIAMYKHRKGKESLLSLYEPNLRRIEVDDGKGLEVVLLLSLEVIREIYLTPNQDSFNLDGAPPTRRKNSRPIPNGSSASPRPDAYAMTSGIGNLSPGAKPSSPVAQQCVSPSASRFTPQAEREREKRDKAEQKRIKRMLDEEEKERKRRDAEVAKETERLRKEFGMEGQDYQPPHLPPRPSPNPNNNAGSSRPTLHVQTPLPPARPLSAEPRPQGGGHGSWYGGPSMGSSFFPGSQPQPGRGRGNGKISKKKSTFF
ncbi:hypothetical protein F5Y18DRAFT_428562 [Xylariaceae sp. FL1019]|nr:hypothetical protein F5Y18DRAFT_428562 [Xylariaceae sp. FL1019]